MLQYKIFHVESLEELETMALDLFDGIENKDVAIPEWQKHPFGPENQKVYDFYFVISKLFVYFFQ